MTCSGDEPHRRAFFAGKGKPAMGALERVPLPMPVKRVRGCTDEATVSFCSSGQLEHACDAGEVAGLARVSESFEGTICGYEAGLSERVGSGGDPMRPGRRARREKRPRVRCTCLRIRTRTCQTRQVGVVEVSSQCAMRTARGPTDAGGEPHRAWWSLYRWFLRLWC